MIKCVYALVVLVGLFSTQGLRADPPTLRLGLIDGRTLAADQISLAEDGRIRYRHDDKIHETAIEDLLRITPESPRDSATRAMTHSREFHLADGGLLTGRILPPGDADPRAIPVDIGHETTVRIPYRALAAVRFAIDEIDEVEQTFRKRIASRTPGRDTLIIAKEGRAVVVPGSLESLDPHGWTFRFGNRTRSGSLDQVYGFVLGAPPIPANPLPATVLMTGGNRFTARLSAADAETVTLDAGPLGRLTLPWSSIRLIDLRSDRIVYLSDLKPNRTVQRSMPGADWPPRPDANVTGGPIRLAGKTYARGLGVHAYTAVSYSLDGQYERFSTIVGIDDAVAPYGSVVFRIVTDSQVAYESKTLRAGRAPETVSVDLTGVHELTLVCDVADELDLSDHADWANAMLVRTREGRPR